MGIGWNRMKKGQNLVALKFIREDLSDAKAEFFRLKRASSSTNKIVPSLKLDALCTYARPPSVKYYVISMELMATDLSGFDLKNSALPILDRKRLVMLLFDVLSEKLEELSAIIPIVDVKLDNIFVTDELSQELKKTMAKEEFDEGQLQIIMMNGLRFGDIGTGKQYLRPYAETFLLKEDTCHCKPKRLAVAMFALTYSFVDWYIDVTQTENTRLGKKFRKHVRRRAQAENIAVVEKEDKKIATMLRESKNQDLGIFRRALATMLRESKNQDLGIFGRALLEGSTGKACESKLCVDHTEDDVDDADYLLEDEEENDDPDAGYDLLDEDFSEADD